MRRIVVRRSPIDGRGVFALTNIQSGELLVEYKSEVTSWRVASQRYQRNSAEDGHTFFFGLDDGHVIDGGRGGNSARWLNPVGQKKWRHGCGHLYDPVKVRAVRIASRQLRSEKPLLG